MIYITGDTHNDIDASNASTRCIRVCCHSQEVNHKEIRYLVVLGDFGLPWYDCPVDENGIHPRNGTDRYLLKWYNDKPFTVLALMGNHDNYDMIQRLPQVEMFGSTALKLSKNVFYLKRGEIYIIEGKSFLVLGGAASTDKAIRIPHVSWWEQEEWSAGEIKRFFDRLEKGGRTFDYVLSHTGPSAGIQCIENLDGLMPDSTVKLNDEVNSRVSYKKWFFGHWHSDWGYENFARSAYVPLYHKGIVV